MHNRDTSRHAPTCTSILYVRFLYFEATGLSATTTTLEFAALGFGEGLLVLVRAYM